jgi:hypothetical protein
MEPPDYKLSSPPSKIVCASAHALWYQVGEQPICERGHIARLVAATSAVNCAGREQAQRINVSPLIRNSRYGEENLVNGWDFHYNTEAWATSVRRKNTSSRSSYLCDPLNATTLHQKKRGVKTPMSQSESRNQPQERPDNWWEFCPVCSSKLNNRKCRFVCSNPQCHYFMSCSEFDM